MSNFNILVVDDDKAIRNLITTTLEMKDYRYQTASTGNAAIMAVLSNNPDVMILDLGLPDMDGVEIIRKVRSWSSIPIIIVSARSDDRDKIEALDEGADDYLTKPFSTEELLARLRVALRRIHHSELITKEMVNNIFINGNLKIDFSAGCAYLSDKEIHLTPNEYKLLCLLAKNIGKVLTHNFILKEIWGTSLPGDTQSLRVFMATLRKKIEKDTSNPKYIQTHVGVGYRMLRIEDIN